MSYVSIQITGGSVLVDEVDAPLVESRQWSLVGGYPTSRRQYLHRLLCPVPAGVEVDHRNGNRLDCRRSNLRPATPAQTAANARKRSRPTSAPWKGVTRDSKSGKWRAQIGHQGRVIYLGLHADQVDAAEAYDAKARELFGDFAAVNFPRPGEQWALRP